MANNSFSSDEFRFFPMISFHKILTGKRLQLFHPVGENVGFDIFLESGLSGGSQKIAKPFKRTVIQIKFYKTMFVACGTIVIKR